MTHFVGHVLERTTAAAPQNLLAEPAKAAHAAKVFGVEQRTRHRNHVDIRARRAGDRQNFVDAGVRMCAAVALPSGQALELDRRLQIVIVEQRGNGIVGARVKRKNKLRHSSPGLTPITRLDSEAGQPDQGKFAAAIAKT